MKKDMGETNSKKVLRKSKGKWIVALLVSTTIGSVALSAEPVQAELNESATQVMRSVSSADFEGKEEVLSEEPVQNESNTALNEISDNWERNSVEKVQEEIERQREQGLNTYVVQWGDSLSVLAEAVGKSVSDISQTNNIENDDLILTGDVINNVLNNVNSPAPSSQSEENGNNVSEHQEDQLGDPLVGTEEASDTDSSNESTDSDANDRSATESESSNTPSSNESNEENHNASANNENPDHSTNGNQSVDGSENNDHATNTQSESTENNEEDPNESNDDPSINQSADSEPNNTENGTNEDSQPTEDNSQEYTTETIETTELIPFEKEETGNDQLEEGTEQVVQEGSDGKRVNYIEVTYNENGEEVSREKVDSAISEEPTSQITEVGTQQVEYQNKTIEKTLPFETETRQNPELPSGTENVIQEGQEGLKEVTYEQKIVNGQFDNSEPVATEVMKEPVNKVVEVGTKDTTSTETDVTEEPIPFETVTRENPELSAGTEQVVQEGQNGSITTTYNVTYENETEVSREQIGDPVRQEPVNEIIEVGTKQEESSTEGSSTEDSSTSVEDVKYGVEDGDTLFSISQKFGTTPEAIADATGISVDTALSPGDTLIIPSSNAEPMDNAQANDEQDVVMLDAGHGGGDTGATNNGTAEKDLNLNLANRLTSELQNRGFEVNTTRSGDISVSLAERSQQANESNADVFISLHHNSLNGNADGVETHYYEHNPNYPSTQNQANHNDGQRITNSKHLADLIQNNLVQSTGADNRGVKTSTFSVNRETDVPAVLVEYGFMDHPEEYANLTDEQYQQALTQAVANAVESYFANVH